MDAKAIIALVQRMRADEAALQAAVESLDLKALRGDRTQKDIAVAADVAQPAISMLENGYFLMSPDTLQRVLKAYLEVPCSI